jgi:hypothetical protein
MFARGSGNAWPLQHYFANPSASAIVSLRRHHSAHLVPTMALITMINQKESKRRSDENEAAVKQQFKNLNYWVERLDSKSSKRRRPDFLISTSSGPLLLCEVKTVDSAFYPRDKKKYGVEHVHISTLDPKFRGSFQGIPIDLTRIDRALADAVRQRAALIADRPETADLPLLVAIFPDPFVAEYLFAYPRSFAERSDDFRKVSGIFRQDASAISPCRRPSYPGLHRAPGKIRRTQAQRIIRLSLRR